MVNLDDLYNGRILELAANIPRTDRLAAPDATAQAHSKLCGSRVTVDLKMEDDVVTDYGQEVKACLLGQSSAAGIGRLIVGTTAAELREVGRLTLLESFRCVRLVLWDGTQRRLVSFREARLSAHRQ